MNEAEKRDYLDRLLSNIMYMEGDNLDKSLFILEVNNPVYYRKQA